MLPVKLLPDLPSTSLVVTVSKIAMYSQGEDNQDWWD
jgi:hypothetical protein